jgi:hypothetical protein
MATLNDGDSHSRSAVIYADGNSHSRFAVIYVDGDGIPVSFLLGNDGLARVTSLRLSLRFRLSEDFMFVDGEVYDALSGHLINTIEQSPVCDGDSKHSLLKHGQSLSHSTDPLQASFSSLWSHE